MGRVGLSTESEPQRWCHSAGTRVHMCVCTQACMDVCSEYVCVWVQVWAKVGLVWSKQKRVSCIINLLIMILLFIINLLLPSPEYVHTRALCMVNCTCAQV